MSNQHHAAPLQVSCDSNNDEYASVQASTHLYSDVNTSAGRCQQPVTPRTSYYELLNDAVLLASINIQHGLLHELSSSGVLNEQQIESITSEPYYTQRVHKLLVEVNMMTYEQQKQFLKALNKTQQSHVSNYICNNGLRQLAIDEDDWPIYGWSECKRIEVNYAQLIELIDTRCGLLHESFATNCISRQQKESISKKSSDADSNDELLKIIKKKSFRDYKTFITCLIRTKQHRVVALLEPNSTSNSQPVSEQLITTLNANHRTLVELIDLETGLLQEMLSADGITRKQKDFIQSAQTLSASNERLLDIVSRGSQSDFNNFIACLSKTGQRHVAHILVNNGVVANMVAQTSLNVTDEVAIIEKFFRILNTTSPAHRKELQSTVNQLVSSLNDCQFIAMHAKHSIKLFILCESVSGLMCLNEMYSSHQLIMDIQQCFTALLDNTELVTINKLEWNLSDYNNCAQYLFSTHGLNLSSLVYQLAQHSTVVTSEPSTSSMLFNRLPHELIEFLLIKAAGQLFVTTKSTTSLACTLTLTVLHTVCRYWWETLRHRQWNRRLLTRYFKLVCDPYSFNPKVLTSLHIEGGGFVVNVAELDGKLYVSDRKNIRVFSAAGSRYYELEKIEMSELRQANDMVACGVTNCLYITDCKTCCIWGVSLSSSMIEKTVKKFIKTDYIPITLSVHSSRLLVSTRSSDYALYVYSCDDGELIRKIKLPFDAYHAYHAVETSDGTVILNYYTNVNKERTLEVCELSVEGEILRTCKLITEVTFHPNSSYLTVDSRKHILVSDSDNKHIVHLNSELKIKRVVLTERELSGCPAKLCYCEGRELLYVSYFGSTVVDVFRL